MPGLKAQADWKTMYDQAPDAFGPRALECLSGQLPDGLVGTLYRNGPARFARGGRQAEHLFDGDGAILRVSFSPAGARASYRYVETEAYLREAAADKLFYGGYGTLPADSLLGRFGKTKNAANTSVLALADRLLALWEGGPPHALDLDTLATTGLDFLSGLQPDQAFSAHPKRDPVSGDIYNFGASYGNDFGLWLYHCDGRTGQLRRQKRLNLPGMGLPMVHDFVLAGPYLIFLISPVLLNPLWFLSRLKSYSDALEWKPEQGTRILVIDRESLERVAEGETEAWYQWHFGNGCLEADGSVSLDLVAYQDFGSNQALGGIHRKEFSEASPGYLTRLCLDPRRAHLLEKVQLMELPGEFPSVRAWEVGQPWNQTWLTVTTGPQNQGDRLPNGLAVYHHPSDTWQISAPAGYSFSEPVHAASEDPDGGWILSLVYDMTVGRSEIWIYAANEIAAGPVCTLALPAALPLTFHGCWQPQKV